MISFCFGLARSIKNIAHAAQKPFIILKVTTLTTVKGQNSFVVYEINGDKI